MNNEQTTKLRLRSTLLRDVVNNRARAMQTILKKSDYDKNDRYTGALQLGILAHCMLLEPEQIEKRYCIFDGDYGGKGYRAVVENPDERRVPMKARYLEQATEMHKVVDEFIQNNDKINHLFIKGEKELPLEYEDHEFIHTIKPDILGNEYFVDYKTTSILYPEKTAWLFHCIQMRLFLQLGYYYMVLGKLGYNIRGAYHIVQTAEKPYHCQLFYFPKKDLVKMQEDVSVAIGAVRQLVKDNMMDCITLNYTKGLGNDYNGDINLDMLNEYDHSAGETVLSDSLMEYEQYL